MTSACPFCGFDQPAVTVLEDAQVKPFISLSPINCYHVLIVPKVHYQHLSEVPAETLASVMRMAQHMSAAIGAVARPDAISLLSDDDLTNSGFNLVPHWKLHLIPRFRNDAVVIDWHRKPDPGLDMRARYCSELRQALVDAGIVVGQTRA